MEFLRKLWSEEEGQGLVEYALIIALVSVMLVLALGTFRDEIGKVFTRIQTELGKAAPATVPGG
ncbi:MAG: Flp family type IVb pilin [Clostridiaceae bacterium]